MIGLCQGRDGGDVGVKLSRLFKRLAYCDALIIDYLGYVQQSREEMEVLFTLLAERYERGVTFLFHYLWGRGTEWS